MFIKDKVQLNNFRLFARHKHICKPVGNKAKKIKKWNYIT